MAFEIIDSRLGAEDYTPRVTIYQRGNLLLNHAAHKMIGEPEKIEVLYDRERNTFAVRPSNGQHAFPLKRPQGRSNQISTSFTRALAAAGIDLASSIYILPVLEDGMLLIPMNEARPI